jgi:hypothetical protein
MCHFLIYVGMHKRKKDPPLSCLLDRNKPSMLIFVLIISTTCTAFISAKIIMIVGYQVNFCSG